MINQKLVQQELGRRGRVSFDSAKGKIARREVQELDRENRRVVPMLKQCLKTIEKQEKLAKKYSWTVDYSNLIRDIKEYIQYNEDSLEKGFDTMFWFDSF